MSRRWKSYRHRFIPWLALNWSSRQIKHADIESSHAKGEEALSQIFQLTKALDSTIPHHTVKQWRKLLSKSQHPADTLLHYIKQGKRVLRDVYGFELAVQRTVVHDGGRGVFVSEGTVREGQVVGLYPGTVYLPFEPLLFQSLGNPFIFRCVDGWMIDGQSAGVSKLIYRACAHRDLIGSSLSCDLTWLTTNSINPLSIGQIVNNHTRDIGPNVEYVEVVIPADFPTSWRGFLPNVFYSGSFDDGADSARLLRVVALMSTRCIQPGEELYSSYFTVVTDG